MRRWLAALAIARTAAADNPAQALEQATDPLPTTTQLSLQPEYTFPHGAMHGVAQLFVQPTIPYSGVVLPMLDVQGFRSLARAQISVETIATVSGLSDLTISDGIVHTVGPVELGLGASAVVPTATDPALGQGTWQVGPVGVIAIPGLPSLQAGVLAQLLWSVAGDLDLAYATIQPVIVVLLPKNCSIFTNDQLSLYWRGGGTTVPINLGVGHAFGTHFVAQLQGSYTVWGAGKGSVQSIVVFNFQL